MRKLIIIAVSAVAFFSAWFIYSKVAQARRETSYRAAIAPFQRDLRVGMPRADLEKYLHSRSLEYHAIYSGETYLIQIGEEPPGNLWCEPWRVYVALEFDSSDMLREIHIRKFGTCL